MRITVSTQVQRVTASQAGAFLTGLALIHDGAAIVLGEESGAIGRAYFGNWDGLTFGDATDDRDNVFGFRSGPNPFGVLADEARSIRAGVRAREQTDLRFEPATLTMLSMAFLGVAGPTRATLTRLESGSIEGQIEEVFRGAGRVIGRVLRGIARTTNLRYGDRRLAGPGDAEQGLAVDGDPVDEAVAGVGRGEGYAAGIGLMKGHRQVNAWSDA